MQLFCMSFTQAQSDSLSANIRGNDSNKHTISDSSFDNNLSLKINLADSNILNLAKLKSIPLKDSLGNNKEKLKQKLKTSRKAAINGVISNQFDHGAIPYYMANNTLPASLYRSNGIIKARAGVIPVIGEYYYANPKFISGLNNYYTIRFDVEEFAKLINQKNLIKTKDLKLGVDSLLNANQKLKQQLASIEMQKIRSMHEPKINLPAITKDSLNVKSDSLSFTKLSAEDSLKQIRSRIDTSFYTMSKLQDQVKDNERKIKEIEQTIKMFEDPKGSLKVDRPGMPKLSAINALSGIKKMEIGMCYPAYSTFLINQMALKGFNFQYEFRKAFINTSIGKTVYQYSVNPTTNSVLNQIQNISSIFNWNGNPQEKKIAALKIGIGNPNKSYLGIGGLFGKGSTSPFSDIIRKNYVVELDGRLIYKFINLEGALAKSFLPDNSSVNTEVLQNDQTALFSKSYQLKAFGIVPKVKTKFSIMFRQVEPYFKSFGVGFMRSDIIRYEGKLEQPLGSKLKIGATYRHDRDNIKNMHGITTSLDNYNYYVRIKLFKKRVDVNLNYSEIFQGVNNLYVNENTLLKSNIKTVVCSYTPRLKKLVSTNTLIYNLYEINDRAVRNNLENVAFNSFNSYRKLQLNLTSSYNRSTITDSLNFTNALNSGIEIGYDLSKKVHFTLGGKHSYVIPLKTSQYGYSSTLNLALHQLFNVELRFEKLVVGDFINTLNYASIQKFPYYGYISLTSKF